MSPNQKACQRRTNLSRGFTLLEIMIAITVIAVLMALTIVCVRAVRGVAVDTKCLVNARTCATGLLAYVGDFDDTLPYFATERDYQHAFWNGPRHFTYFDQSHHWPLAARQYLSGGRFLQEAQCPGSPIFLEDRAAYLAQYPDDYIYTSAYAIALGALSDPAYWTEGPARIPPEPPQWVLRPVRASETTFPADKGFLIEQVSNHSIPNSYAQVQATQLALWRPQAAERTFSTVMVDGAAALLRPAHDLLPGFRNKSPVLSTSDGIRGRDRRQS